MDKVYWTNGVATLYRADARQLPLLDGSVHCVVTSPPYWGMRDYGLAEWRGGDPACSHLQRLHRTGTNVDGAPSSNHDHAQEPWPGGTCGRCGAVQQQLGIGQEPTIEGHIASIVQVFRELRRVLRDDGTIWLNYGEVYAGGGRGGNPNGKQGTNKGTLAMPRSSNALPSKNLLGIPWRIALALQQPWLCCRECEEVSHQSEWGRFPNGRLICPSCVTARGSFVETAGFVLRSAIFWFKPNPMTESVTDRPTKAYEMVFLLSKKARYFYDGTDLRTPYATSSQKDRRDNEQGHRRNRDYPGAQSNGGTMLGGNRHGGANARNVWVIPTQGRPDAHFATFPDELVRRCLLAGTSECGVCATCDTPWERIDSLGWQPLCDCHAPQKPAVVLDPFVGSGTTCAVAQSMGRYSIGVDLSTEYLEIARRQIESPAYGPKLPMLVAD